MGRFKGSYSGFGAFLRGEELQGEMRSRAEKIAAAAEASAPVGSAADGDRHPGEYKASFHVESGAGPSLRGVRAYGRVTNTAPHAAAVEWGNSHSPAQHVLGRAIDHARD